jgi:hypothetical protein
MRFIDSKLTTLSTGCLLQYFVSKSIFVKSHNSSVGDPPRYLCLGGAHSLYYGRALTNIVGAAVEP